MKKVGQKTYKGFRSFAGKARVAFYLSAILPYLVGVYLFVDGKIDISEIILLFAALALFSMLTGFMLLRNSGNQLGLLASETGRIRMGETNDSIRIEADQEINDIAEHFNAIVGKMHATESDMREQSVQLMTYARDISRSFKQAKEEERLRNKLSRYVGKNLVDKLVNEKGGVPFENEKKEVTVLFADIRSFTAIAERMAAEDLVTMLNSFFDVMAEIVFANNGVLDKFVGDQIVVVFGLLTTTGAEHDAVKAAVEMQRATGQLMKTWKEQGKIAFGIGIGINTGTVLVGNVGSRTRMDYTVMGDCVNVSARLQQLAKAGEIIIGQETHRRIRRRFKADKRIIVRVKNKAEPLECYRIAIPIL
uniref:Adenylate/guanylate cyclase domain-containing protein n=1 Tax=Candidatus Desulfatibia profunda TaxID=2841695 RepID=A0A8J6TJV2_9BACT|nr:adenylate/guanylate cyclase domain-containing protein [Candidatus Desulfatibia profunda]